MQFDVIDAHRKKSAKSCQNLPYLFEHGQPLNVYWPDGDI